MKRGFTLLELAIVLVIIGLLIGGGMSIFSILVKRGKVIETKNTLKSNIESIISYSVNNFKLPNQQKFKEIAKSLKDSWGKDFLYIPANNLLEDNTICGRKTTNLTVKICPDSTCSSATQVIENIAFVILSGGGNYNIQTANNSGEIKVYDRGVKVDDNTTDVNRVEEYDDIVDWVTLNELKAKANCQEYRLKILNNSLPSGYVGSDYNAEIFAEGGIPNDDNKYKWCYKGNLPEGLRPIPDKKCENGWSEEKETFKITGTPQKSGNYNITIYVKDNSDNNASKSFVITINQSSSGGGSGGGGWLPPIPKPLIFKRH